MTPEDRAWFKAQAKLIREDEQQIRTHEKSFALHRWQIGDALNAIYGIYEGQSERHIPIQDKADLTQIFGIPAYMLNECRRVHRYAPTSDQFDKVLEEYGTWTAITSLWLTNRPSTAAARGSREAQREIVAHIANWPDDLRDRIMEMTGWSRSRTREALALYAEQAVTPGSVIAFIEREQRRHGLTVAFSG